MGWKQKHDDAIGTGGHVGLEVAVNTCYLVWLVPSCEYGEAWISAPTCTTTFVCTKREVEVCEYCTVMGPLLALCIVASLRCTKERIYVGLASLSSAGMQQHTHQDLPRLEQLITWRTRMQPPLCQPPRVGAFRAS